jgi:hypothetical protein
MPNRRITLSMNISQAQWLDKLMTMVRSGADTRVLIRSDLAASVSRIVQRARMRADGTETASLGRTKRDECCNGHEYTPENTRYQHGFRRCVECKRVASKKYEAKRRMERIKQKQEESWAAIVEECDRRSA